MGVRLPSVYQETEYIQGRICANPAYIDTLYIPTVNTKLRVKFSPDNNNRNGFFGARKDPYRFYCATFSYGSQVSCGMTVNTWPSTKLSLSNGSIYDATIQNGQSNINGTVISTPSISASQWSDTIGTIQLWSLASFETFEPDATAKYYLCQIWENDVLVCDFVPCYRKSDNEPGMYDLVSRTFFTNAGTGEFTVGPDVIDSISPLMVAWRRAMMSQKQPRLPIEYQEVPFIIGQGSQYIDTGYVLNSECRVQGRYDLYGTSSELRSVFALFGSRNSNYNNTFAIFNVTAAPRTDYGKTITTHSFSYVLINNRNRVDFDLNAGIATVNGSTYAFSDSLKPFTCPSTALIFAAHTGNTVDTRCPKGEIVYIKITDENGIVVRDMIPCYRKADNKPGMYDLANNQFYTNAGTGDFQLPS